MGDEITRLEESLRRLDEADPDEVDPDEYAETLRRLVELRAERDGGGP